MKKLFVSIFIAVMTVFAVFAADPIEGYWMSYDDETNEITAGWKFYINSKGQMEAVIVYSPECDVTTLADECKGLKPIKDFPIAGEFTKMKVLYDTPWIFGLEKKSEGVWENGIIIDCGEGKKYNCKVTFAPADGKKYKVDTLIMRGSIGPIGVNQLWLRPDDEVVKTLKVRARGITDFIDMIEKK